MPRTLENAGAGKSRRARLGDVCEVRRGTSITRKRTQPGDIPVVAGGLSSPYSHSEANRPANTVTVSGSGAHAGFVNFYKVPIFASDCTTVIPKDAKKLLPVFVYRFLQSQQSYIYENLKHGAAQPHVYPRDIAELLIPVPPLAEQKRIVATLDKVFAEIAAAVANAEKSVAKVSELFESEMHYAFRGKPANCGKKKSTEYLLEQVAAISAGNSAPQDKTLFEDGKHPFVRTADVGKIRFGTVDSTADYLNDKGVAKLRRFPRGTILFPKSGASTFLNHRVMMGFDGYVSSHLATIVPDAKKVDPQFLLYFLHTVKAQDLVQDHGYPSLNLPLIKAIRICLPPMSEQKRIAGKLGKVTTATKSLVALSRRKSGALADLEKSILWQTFSGEAR